ncbi:hypothetical protein [Bacillus haynesii]|uniref:hypothetical protein n=1 Tax=Bacillus haynesii TaxID=1925021 RepID=UPI0004B19706|nr:hypothetical protein [Bacillus haynesii]
MTEKKDYERMKGEIADLRCAVARLIGENEQLKNALKLIESKSELPEKPVDLVPITELFEINLHAKEALK